MSPSGGLNDLDSRIAALEAQLGGIDSDSDVDGDGSQSAEARGSGGGGGRDASSSKEAKKERKEKKRGKKSKKEKKRLRSREEEDGSSSSSELEAIAPLPEHLLPEHNDYAGKNVGKRRKKLKTGFLASREAATGAPAPAGADDGASAPAADPPPILALLARRKNLPKCEVCAKEFTSQAQLEEHNRGKAHLKATRAARTPNSSAVAGVPPRGEGVSPRGAAEAADARVRRDPRLARRRPPACRTARCAEKPSRRTRNSPNTIEASGTSCASAGNSPRAENRTAPSDDRCAVRERWARARATKHLYEIPVSTPPRDDEITRLYHDL